MLFVFAVPYGLGAGAIDASVNHYVANNYSGSVMNFLHCFYGVGAVISPSIMALALKYARWNEGYRWTAFVPGRQPASFGHQVTLRAPGRE